MVQKEFVEYQRFNQKLLWIGITALILTPIFIALFIKKGALISVLVAVPIIILLLMIRLKTVINEKGISAKFFPIILTARNFEWSEIEKVYVRKYKPISEYGGWGLRITFKNGTAYTVKGRYGIQLELKNGKRVLIGTQKKDEVEQVLAQFSKIEQ